MEFEKFSPANQSVNQSKIEGAKAEVLEIIDSQFPVINSSKTTNQQSKKVRKEEWLMHFEENAVPLENFLDSYIAAVDHAKQVLDKITRHRNFKKKTIKSAIARESFPYADRICQSAICSLPVPISGQALVWRI